MNCCVIPTPIKPLRLNFGKQHKPLRWSSNIEGKYKDLHATSVKHRTQHHNKAKWKSTFYIKNNFETKTLSVLRCYMIFVTSSHVDNKMTACQIYSDMKPNPREFYAH